MDAVDHRDLPVTQPRPVLTRAHSVTVMERGDPADPAVEALLLMRRETVTVIDFYRHRPEER